MSNPPPVIETAPTTIPAPPMADWGRLHFVAALAVIGACWMARELLVPICVGLFIGLVANPAVTRLRRWHVPRWIGAMAVVFGG
ncbi:MAG: AI-2E family transporter, partial [Pseudoxanthomonas sp.]